MEYLKNFDGERLVVPCINPSISMDVFKPLGTILSHSFMSCGFMPIRIAFPVIASVLLGPEVDIPNSIVFESFVDFLSCHDSAKVKDALINKSSFDKQVILSILSRYDCTEMPNAENVKQLIFGVARHVLLGRPLGNLYKMRAGVPTPFKTFWSRYTVSDLFTVYKSLNATSSSVLPLVTEPMGMIAAETRVFNYLLTFISNMKDDELRLFLRFVTGSSVLISDEIKICFNGLSGFARRPLAHTCGDTLELSVAYDTFPEFEDEFKQVLSSEFAWIMDST